MEKLKGILQCYVICQERNDLIPQVDINELMREFCTVNICKSTDLFDKSNT